MKAKDKKDNPYESPTSEIEFISSLPIYHGKLYSVLSIAIATIFGSVLAAGFLLQSNFNKFQQNTASLITISITTIATIIFLFSSLFINRPSFFVYLSFNFIVAILVFPVAHLLQGEKLEQHEQADRPFHSVFKTIGIGVLCFFAMGIMLFLALALFFTVPIN
ncbi:hypothetical protein [Aliikangiella sp. IMCC44359]|uniref:hypothetical protein n=1 Tax=Aliikangiella sp. IMCC44359 TaxID=3459125 RepID=UPI00403B1038